MKPLTNKDLKEMLDGKKIDISSYVKSEITASANQSAKKVEKALADIDKLIKFYMEIINDKNSKIFDALKILNGNGKNPEILETLKLLRSSIEDIKRHDEWEVEVERDYKGYAMSYRLKAVK